MQGLSVLYIIYFRIYLPCLLIQFLCNHISLPGFTFRSLVLPFAFSLRSIPTFQQICISTNHQTPQQFSTTTSNPSIPLSALSTFNTSTTSSPPTDPPPAPPPLNLPPSRARRQFAARLALHSQQAQQAQAQAQADALATSSSSSSNNTSSNLTPSISTNHPAQLHPQELYSPPTIAVTQHGDEEEDTDSSDDGIVTMHIPHASSNKAASTTSNDPSSSGNRHDTSKPRQGSSGELESLDPYGVDASGGSGSSDEDVESEEMRFGGEGLEGFVHSPRAMEDLGPEGDDGGLVGREEGHEEDLGRKA